MELAGDSFLSSLKQSVKLFKAGRLKQFIAFWKILTNDINILHIVNGCNIEFDSFPCQSYMPHEYVVKGSLKSKMDLEIERMLDKQIIELVHSLQPGAFVSNIFPRLKKDGNLRIILNLKELNKCVTYRHFKMQTLQAAIRLMKQNCFMASIDWKDAYYSVSIDKQYRKYLCFQWNGQMYQFTCLPNGLASAPRLFTKLTKPFFAKLRTLGYQNSSYIDDAFLVAETNDICEQNVLATVQLSINSGFVVHPEKSVFKPTQELVYLGFILNSTSMTVTLTTDKAYRLKSCCQNILDKRCVSIRTIAECVGLMVSSFPGVKLGQLYYRLLDNAKTEALKQAKGNYEAMMIVPSVCVEDLLWWIENIECTYNNIIKNSPDLVLQSDASSQAWGGVKINKIGENSSTGGNWSLSEKAFHINVLELLAAEFTLKCFCKEFKNCHVLIQIDNSTAVAYLNNLGGKRYQCNLITRRIWQWCSSKNIWLSAAFIPGVSNLEADYQSRLIHEAAEWKLNPQVLEIVSKTFGNPTIDLFASRLNHQVRQYVSWKPDPTSIAVDAFSFSWSNLENAYIFPPFCMLMRVLQKIEQDKASCIVIAPYWTSQPWFSKLTNLLFDCPFIFPCRKNTLTHPTKDVEEFPLMFLMACHLSRNTCRTKEFHRKLQTSLCVHGEIHPKDNMLLTSNSGISFAPQGMLITWYHL